MDTFQVTVERTPAVLDASRALSEEVFVAGGDHWVLNMSVMRSTGQVRETPRAMCGMIPLKTSKRLGLG